MERQDLFTSLSTIRGETWLASHLLNRQVINAATLEPLGRIIDTVFDPLHCQLAAIIIQPKAMETGIIDSIRRRITRQHGIHAIGLEHIVSLSGDVVVVDVDPSHPASSRAVDSMPRLREVCELAIITLHGMCLGSLADVLLDGLGSTITGYVVNPTVLGEDVLPPLEIAVGATLPHTQIVQADGSEEPAQESSEEVPVANLRILPASPRIRIGDSMILVFEDVQPLQKEVVVIKSAVEV